MIKVAFYFWLCRVFAAARGLSLVVGRKGHLWLQRAAFSLRGLLSLQNTGSSRQGSSSCGKYGAEHGLSSCDLQACSPRGMWGFLRPRPGPVSPALQAELLSTVP